MGRRRPHGRKEEHLLLLLLLLVLLTNGRGAYFIPLKDF